MVSFFMQIGFLIEEGFNLFAEISKNSKIERYHRTHSERRLGLILHLAEEDVYTKRILLFSLTHQSPKYF